MKTIILIALTLGLCACEPATLKWGYVYNPEFILLKAKEAAEKKDIGTWREVTSGHPYCKYGSKDGLIYLQKHLSGTQFIGVKEGGTQSFKREGGGDVVFTPNYIRYYSTSLVDKSMREKASIKIKCQYELSKSLSDRDPYNTTQFSRAFCTISEINIRGSSFSGNEVCDDLK